MLLSQTLKLNLFNVPILHRYISFYRFSTISTNISHPKAHYSPFHVLSPSTLSPSLSPPPSNPTHHCIGSPVIFTSPLPPPPKPIPYARHSTPHVASHATLYHSSFFHFFTVSPTRIRMLRTTITPVASPLSELYVTPFSRPSTINLISFIEKMMLHLPVHLCPCHFFSFFFSFSLSLSLLPFQSAVLSLKNSSPNLM